MKSDDHIDESDPIYRIVEDNRPMILSVAAKVLGVFDSHEVMSEAYIAARLCIKNKRDPLKKSKGQTVLYWYLQKQFQRLRDRTGAFADFSERAPVDQDREEPLSPTDFLLDPCNPGEYHEDIFEGDPEEHTLTNKFVVHCQSFQHLVPYRTLKALKVLADGTRGISWQGKMDILKRGYQCASELKVRRIIYQELISSVSRAGASLYVATCVNGANNTILLASKSLEEARTSLPKKYGKFIRITKYMGE